jgi:hypothetical protein
MSRPNNIWFRRSTGWRMVAIGGRRIPVDWPGLAFGRHTDKHGGSPKGINSK